ncbi:MAG TPA: NAD(P)H-dependent oxidoreductase [Candidatus Saccharimonadales bacterium]
MAKIAVVIGSVREGARVSEPIARWVAKSFAGKAEAEVLDLKDYPMSFLDEPGAPPRYNPARHPKPAAQKWIDKVVQFDGYVLVTPEYNRSTSAVLKNAIDHIDHQMDDKPVAVIGHGSSGGAQAVATLRMVLPGVGAVVIPTALFLQNSVAEKVDAGGTLDAELAKEPYGPQAQLDGQIDSLLWYADALKTAREKNT